MHRPQNRRHVAALVEKLQKRFVHVLVSQKGAVHQGKLVANQLRQVGVQLQAALLGVKEDPHHAARLVPKNAVGSRMNLAAQELEPVHELLLETAPAVAEQLAEGGEPPFRLRQQGQPLLQRTGNDVNVAHMAVQVAHERLQAFDRRTVSIAKVVRDRRLKAFGQHVRRAIDVVMQVVADAKQTIVGGFELFPLAFAD